MLPLVPGEPRQREFAFRAGVNIVMYALTGNYKADQVHIPALLERLGNRSEREPRRLICSAGARTTWCGRRSASPADLVLLLVARSRGALLRALALGLMVLALANPSLTREDRDPIPSVAAVIVDKSPSQDFGDRNQQTEAARAALVERLKRIPGLEVRVAEAGAADGETDGTKLFSALSSTLADVPPDRVAGAILITDGRVHDVPADAAALGFAAPLHALITGHPDEIDRRVVLTQTPRFGIVGQSQTIGFRVEDQGARPAPPKSPCAATARCWKSASSRPVPTSSSTCRSRTPVRTSSKSRPRRSKANSRRSTTAPWSRSTACATSCACCWSPASRMPASAPGATCSSRTPRSISSTSRSCGRRKSRTARRSTNCR